MTSPITEQARQVASRAIQDKPAGLNNPRASSFLGPETAHCPQCSAIMPGSVCGTCGWKALVDKPVTVRKWFPTGHLAWRNVPDSRIFESRPTICGWQLVQELFEVEFTDDPDYASRTGRIEWRQVPILPSDAPVSTCAEIIIPAFDSSLINQAPHIAGPNQVPPAPG